MITFERDRVTGCCAVPESQYDELDDWPEAFCAMRGKLPSVIDTRSVQARIIELPA